MEIDDYLDYGTTSGDDGNDDVNENEISNDNGSPRKKWSQFQQERYKKLGFIPQKEIFCNKYLPYADQLDDESQKMLTQLKEGLAKAVALREMTPAVGLAISRLLVFVVMNMHTESISIIY